MWNGSIDSTSARFAIRGPSVSVSVSQIAMPSGVNASWHGKVTGSPGSHMARSSLVVEVACAVTNAIPGCRALSAPRSSLRRSRIRRNGPAAAHTMVAKPPMRRTNRNRCGGTPWMRTSNTTVRTANTTASTPNTMIDGCRRTVAPSDVDVARCSLTGMSDTGCSLTAPEGCCRPS
ncbi:hypothetical protein DEI90_14395 [Curtobacterium sp. MCBD17_031]|nr:hypothetical protein DEI90_14395 [Curtobacterium sp. MCBD17_031]